MNWLVMLSIFFLGVFYNTKLNADGAIKITM